MPWKRSVLVILLVAPLLMLQRTGVGAAKAGKFAMTEKRLLVISPGRMETVIKVRVGDMLQLEPFAYPVVPKYLGTRLQVRLRGDRVLELIGQTDTPNVREGRSGRSAFLYVRSEGKTSVNVVLVNSEDERIGGYEASYVVVAEN